VGKGQRSRWRHHFYKCHNPRLEEIILAGGVYCEIVRKNLTSAEACEFEIEMIKSIGRSPNGPLANMTDGGDGLRGHKHSEEFKRLISSIMKDKEFSELTRSRMSLSAKERDRSAGYSESHKAKIAAGVALYWECRRKAGLPLTNRGPEGHEKHRQKMLALYEERRRLG
jgi:hypothetical protein